MQIWLTKEFLNRGFEAVGQAKRIIARPLTASPKLLKQSGARINQYMP
jgi:hypothetical protein